MYSVVFVFFHVKSCTTDNHLNGSSDIPKCDSNDIKNVSKNVLGIEKNWFKISRFLFQFLFREKLDFYFNFERIKRASRPLTTNLFLT